MIIEINMQNTLLKFVQRSEINTVIHSFIRFWHAPLWMRSAKRRHQSPEWTIL